MAAATRPLNVPEGRKARGRLQLLLILLVVLGPMILATSQYSFWYFGYSDAAGGGRGSRDSTLS